VLNVAVALVPVVVFLAGLALLDSFRLVRPLSIAAALAYGAAAAAASLQIHEWLLRVGHVPATVVGRFLAPVVEETAKAAFVVALLVTARIAFLVDAAIEGFAVGAGFALVENVWYLSSIGSAAGLVWIVRGLGTAVLQGATTTIFAVVTRTMLDRQPARGWTVFVPGWVAAVLIHAAFNSRLLPPVAETLVLLIALPLLVIIVFDRSERATREWIGAGLDLDVQLLGLVNSDRFAATRMGRYLQELRARVPRAVVVDMFCLLRLELEIAVAAKAVLLAREAGLELSVDADLEASLAERRHLQASIGKAGLLALKPLQVSGDRDRWHRRVLTRRASRQSE
jgi:RsiW-degrading membrane proteinase PrsW (M82 family)